MAVFICPFVFRRHRRTTIGRGSATTLTTMSSMPSTPGRGNRDCAARVTTTSIPSSYTSSRSSAYKNMSRRSLPTCCHWRITPPPETGFDPVADARAFGVYRPGPQSDLPNGFIGMSVGDRKGIAGPGDEPVVLSGDIREGFIDRVTRRHRRDERYERVGRGSLHHSDVAVAERPEPDSHVAEPGKFEVGHGAVAGSMGPR